MLPGVEPGCAATRGVLVGAVFRNAKHLAGIFAMHAPVVFRRAICVYTDGDLVLGTTQNSRHFSCAGIALQRLGCVSRAARQESDPYREHYDASIERDWLHTLNGSPGRGSP